MHSLKPSDVLNYMNKQTLLWDDESRHTLLFLKHSNAQLTHSIPTHNSTMTRFPPVPPTCGTYRLKDVLPTSIYNLLGRRTVRSMGG